MSNNGDSEIFVSSRDASLLGDRSEVVELYSAGRETSGLLKKILAIFVSVLSFAFVVYLALIQTFFIFVPAQVPYSLRLNGFVEGNPLLGVELVYKDSGDLGFMDKYRLAIGDEQGFSRGVAVAGEYSEVKDCGDKVCVVNERGDKTVTGMDAGSVEPQKTGGFVLLVSDGKLVKVKSHNIVGYVVGG